MKKDNFGNGIILSWFVCLAASNPAGAQVPVDDDGATISAVETGTNEIPLLSAAELEELVGPIALYPDDLLAIVLPASTYPLQLVQADRFLQDVEDDSQLEPDESWDDSIVALLNYPEAIELMTRDLDKTWRLGEAVVAQQADVIAAIESFRDKAYAAGNLQSDTRQTVAENDGVIEITPVEEDVIYVPYYEPEEVVVYQPRPVYYYYPRAYPLYYYPYPYGYRFSYGFFWGVTTAFTVGWFSDSLHVYHQSYYGHPFYGSYYGYNYWYRRPSIQVHNNYYFNNNYVYNRHGHGDYWRPRSGGTVSHHDQRVTRSRHYPGNSSRRPDSDHPEHRGRQSVNQPVASATRKSAPVKFRQRTSTTSNQSSSIRPAQATAGKSQTVSGQRRDIEFKQRPGRIARADSSVGNRQPAAQRQAQPGQSRAATESKPRQPVRSTQSRAETQPESQKSARVTQPRAKAQARPGATGRSSQVRRPQQQASSAKASRSSAPRQQARASVPRQQTRASSPKQQSGKAAPGKMSRAASQGRDRAGNRRR